MTSFGMFFRLVCKALSRGLNAIFMELIYLQGTAYASIQKLDVTVA